MRGPLVVVRQARALIGAEFGEADGFEVAAIERALDAPRAEAAVVVVEIRAGCAPSRSARVTRIAP
ncbi:hypothetical protein MBEHAL_2081 [Halarchaeum acidiphilum MH1-52-1]|uniref:Uncharacterized protein n=1 Tax=Halarchaeum acidiphilum MH1-52-1 TaxID=1261545 RepID=U2YGE9_9EURY|nr:hypothetical protein MBEHAL_2081 [Halarchaeum acidiphilum MH1-52-1]